MDYAHVMNREYDEQCQQAEAQDIKARKISDAKLDNMTIGDVHEALEYLTAMDIARLTRAVADGDSMEIGDLVIKGAQKYADTLADQAEIEE